MDGTSALSQDDMRRMMANLQSLLAASGASSDPTIAAASSASASIERGAENHVSDKIVDTQQEMENEISCTVVNSDTTYSAGTAINITTNGETNTITVDYDTDTMGLTEDNKLKCTVAYDAGTGMTLNGTTFNCDVVDTTYSAGTAINITTNGETNTITVDYDTDTMGLTEDNKLKCTVNTDTTYTGGTDISINADNVISYTGLPNVVAAGTYGDAFQYPAITVDTKGRITGVSLFNPLSSGWSYTSGTENIADVEHVSFDAYVAIGDGARNNPEAFLHIREDTGTPASTNEGTIILDHENPGGKSSIMFRSKVNRGSDYGYIQYQDNSTGAITGENAILTIGTQNDGDDHIALMPSGNVGVNRTNPSYKLDVNGSFRSSSINTGSITTGTSFTTGNKYIYSGNEATNIGLWFGTPFNGTYDGASKSAIIADAHTNHSRHNLYFCLNTAANNTTNASLSDIYMGLDWGGVIEVRKPFWGNTNGNHLSFRTGYTKTSDQVRMDANGDNYQVKNSLFWAQSSVSGFLSTVPFIPLCTCTRCVVPYFFPPLV